MNFSANPLELLVTPALFAVLIWIAIIDMRTLRIPDKLTVPLIFGGLLLSAITAQSLPLDAMIGACVGFGVFAIFGEIFFRLRGQEGLGLGDAKLLGAAGAWLGWALLPALVLIAAVSALAYAIILRKTQKVAFGPWIAAAFAILWLRHILTIVA